MPSPLIAVNWIALLQVAGVTILAAGVISVLMSLSNWLMTPVVGAEHPTVARRALGVGSIVLVGLIVLFGLYLMIPYFHPKR